MAKFLGIYASGIAVAQLAGSIVASSKKIYTFWANAKDALKNVTDLITEVELLGALLLEFYDQYNNSGQNNFAIMGAIVKHCRDVMKELDEILRKMEEGMKKSKGKAARQWTGAKVALKGHIVQDITNRLERAKSLLILARSSNAGIVIRSIDMTMIKFLESTSKQISPPYPTETNAIAPSKVPSVHNTRKGTRTLIKSNIRGCKFGIYRSLTYVRRDCNKARRLLNEDDNTIDNELVDIDIEIQFIPRGWLRMIAFSMIQSRRFGRWKYTYQSVCIMPNDSPIFTACSNEDQNEIICLIKQKKEVFLMLMKRVGPYSMAALHIAAEYSGRLTPTIENYGKDYQIEHSIQYQKMMIRPVAEVLDTIRVLVEFGQCDSMAAGPVTKRCEESSRTLSNYCRTLAALDIYSGSPEAFRYLKRESYLHPPNELFEFPFRTTVVKYIRFGHIEDTGDIIFLFEMYDYQRDIERIEKKLIDPCR